MIAPAPADRCRALRAALARGTVVFPGAVNALSARAIEKAGFDGIYLSGAVLANSVGGVPDIGLMTLTELREHAAHIANCTTVPILADADTGFGGPENTARTVHELESVGVSGIHLEDQELPKRCGHLGGKKLVPVEEMTAKIRSAVAARHSPDFLVLARTDARGVTGYGDAVTRARCYLEAGADGIFPEAMESREELARFARDVGGLLLANMTEFGRTPRLPVPELAALGYRIIIFPVTLQRVAMRTMEDCLRKLREEGTQDSFLDRMQTREELYRLLDYEPGTGSLPGGAP